MAAASSSSCSGSSSTSSSIVSIGIGADDELTVRPVRVFVDLRTFGCSIDEASSVESSSIGSATSAVSIVASRSADDSDGIGSTVLDGDGKVDETSEDAGSRIGIDGDNTVDCGAVGAEAPVISAMRVGMYLRLTMLTTSCFACGNPTGRIR